MIERKLFIFSKEWGMRCRNRLRHINRCSKYSYTIDERDKHKLESLYCPKCRQRRKFNEQTT